MKHYTARVERSGKWWAITVDGLKGAHSQAKRLDKVEGNARELIALMTDAEPESFAVDVVQDLPAELRDVLATYLALSNELSELAVRVGEAQELAVDTLVKDGLSMRDIGVLTHLSFQRVSQVVHGQPKETRRVSQTTKPSARSVA